MIREIKLPDGWLNADMQRATARVKQWEREKPRMTTYTKADMEKWREACANEAAATSSFDDALQRAHGCSTSGERVAARIRALPIPPPAEE